MEKRSLQASKVALLTILAGLCQVPLAATTIVALRADSMVVIGADSLELDLGDRQGPEQSACKIVRVGNRAAASSGVTRFEGFFDVNQLAREVLRGQKPLATRVETFGQKLLTALRRAMREPRSAAELYRIAGRASGRLVTTIFVGFERGAPHMVRQSYRASPAVAAPAEAAIQMDSRTCPSRECVADLYVAGRADSIDAAIRRERVLAEPPGGAVAFVRHLIGLEIQTAPHLVAGPVDVLTIDGNGVASWAEGSKPECMR